MSAPRIAAVIGSPVAHSLSPAIHQAAFDAAGVNWAYAAFDVTDARAALSAMRLLGIAGLSVTMPLNFTPKSTWSRSPPWMTGSS